MKLFTACALFIMMTSCNQRADHYHQMQSQIDSLKSKLDSTYRPGFGEFMSEIQVHHEKLWFAGINNNWKLADFEVNEIKESLADIRSYCTDRPETKYLGMIDLPVDSISTAIREKNLSKFKEGFTVLTNTCNSCHHEVNHGFNVIRIPVTPPFSNQDFKGTQ